MHRFLCLILYGFCDGGFIHKHPLFYYAVCTVNLLLKHNVTEAGFASIFTWCNKNTRCTLRM